ncbi:hypothetical protein LJK87_24840 [Paenibacillus sp. P25]|nr:hypothetical protein LJK87_24840 [Paenibacillus sp. P25]
MSILNQLLLNMFVIITPIMLYQVFWIDRLGSMSPKWNRILITAFAGLASVFCMLHPFELQPGLRYDLRLAPLILCFIYIGFRYALAIAAVIIALRLYLGGDGMIGGIATALIVLVLLLLSRRILKKGTRLCYTLTGMGLGFALGIILLVLTVLLNRNLVTPLTGRTIAFFLLDGLIYAVTIGIAVNVVEQIKENLALRRKMQDSDKMNVLSELAASFAHEIRNPMTVARGFMQMMKQSDLPEEKRRLYHQMVLEEMDRTQAIINNYLSFARPTLEAIELLDAKGLILQAVQSVRTYAELRQVKIETQLEDKLIISANADKFIQCIVNLCKNGIEAMPGGGGCKLSRRWKTRPSASISSIRASA